jgi:rhodanese-related sulfurtransferase
MEYKKWLEESGRHRWRGDTEKNEISNNSSISVSSSIKNSFFDAHKNDALSISNRQFQDIYINSLPEYLVLDAREEIEYENGHFPSGIHIRFADLKAGRWQELPVDKKVVVICWSGIRGKETAEFLRSKGIVALYLEKGANGWVEFGGAWEGNIKFAQKYSERRFELVFSTQQIKKKIQEGVVLVDSREPIKFAAKHVPGSFNISMFSTATADLPQVFSQIPQGSTVITVCDDYVNCFDAKITGVELERRGYTFLGRYNKPWEF